MAQLLVRNLEEDVVARLKRRAAANGRSAEEEHRQLLRRMLQPERVADLLLSMPAVGSDADFARIDEMPSNTTF